MSNEELSRLFQEFKEAESSELSEDVKERQEKKEFIQQNLSEENLSDYAEGDLRELVRSLWAFQMWTNKDYIVDEMLKDGLDALRKHFKTALHESSSVKAAFSELVGNVRMMGPAAASEILSSVYPDRCAIWNRKAKQALDQLSYSDETSMFTGQTLSSDEYGEFNDVLLNMKASLEDQGHQVDDLLELDYFLYYILEEAPPEEEEVEDFIHDEVRNLLRELGDGLGFDVDVEYQAAPGAQIDVRWSTKVANLGRIAYAFEVHRRGSRDSAILNLQKARNADPSIQKLILVSTKEEIEKFKDEVDALGGEFPRFISYMVVDKAFEASDHLTRLKEILQEVGLMEKIG